VTGAGRIIVSSPMIRKNGKVVPGRRTIERIKDQRYRSRFTANFRLGVKFFTAHSGT